MKPLAIDLFCGLGGWAEGFLAEGYRVVGFDIERHDYGTGGYPGQLVIQDVLTLHGRQFKDAAVIVASPPCQAYSYRAMPWSRAKALPPPDNSLFEACFRIQREAIEAAGRFIPLVVENVKGAQKWVGKARAHFGSFYLWGDVGQVGKRIVAGNLKYGQWVAPVNGTKVPGLNFSGSDKPGYVAKAFNDTAIKNMGGSWFAVAHNTTSGHSRNPVHEHIKEGGDWWNKECRKTGMARLGPKSKARKAASAMIAKIPFPLSQHIARCYMQRILEAPE